jgi:hypothetical protein
MSEVDRAREERRLQDLASERRNEERRSQEQKSARQRAALFVPSERAASAPRGTTTPHARPSPSDPARRSPLPPQAPHPRKMQGPAPAAHDAKPARPPGAEAAPEADGASSMSEARVSRDPALPWSSESRAQAIGLETSFIRRRPLPDEELKTDDSHDSEGESSPSEEPGATLRTPTLPTQEPATVAQSSRSASLSEQFEKIAQLARLCEGQRGEYGFDFSLRHPGWSDALGLRLTSLGKRRIRVETSDGSPLPDALDLAALRRELQRRGLELLVEET